eukprot:6121836-Prymnesium_polylepis.1
MPLIFERREHPGAFLGLACPVASPGRRSLREPAPAHIIKPRKIGTGKRTVVVETRYTPGMRGTHFRMCHLYFFSFNLFTYQ